MGGTSKHANAKPPITTCKQCQRLVLATDRWVWRTGNNPGIVHDVCPENDQDG